MAILTTLRRWLEPSDQGRAVKTGATGASRPPEMVAAVTAPPPTAEQAAARRHRVRLVIEDLDTGEGVVLAETASWRSIEVLGSAALYYAAHYDNPQRPLDQVRARRGEANQLGAAIWEIAEGMVGIEAP